MSKKQKQKSVNTKTIFERIYSGMRKFHKTRTN